MPRGTTMPWCCRCWSPSSSFRRGSARSCSWRSCTFFPASGSTCWRWAVVLLVGAAVWFFWSLFSRPETDLLTPRWFQEMLPPPATRPGEAAAQLVAQLGLAGSGRPRLVGGRDVSRPLDRQRPLLPRVGRDVRRADLPQGLLASRRPRLAADPRADGLVRPHAEPLPGIPLASRAADPGERRAAVPPRSVAMVPVPDPDLPPVDVLHERASR